jgi:hypothetical protein
LTEAQKQALDQAVELLQGVIDGLDMSNRKCECCSLTVYGKWSDYQSAIDLKQAVQQIRRAQSRPEKRQPPQRS